MDFPTCPPQYPTFTSITPSSSNPYLSSTSYSNLYGYGYSSYSTHPYSQPQPPPYSHAQQPPLPYSQPQSPPPYSGHYNHIHPYSQSVSITTSITNPVSGSFSHPQSVSLPSPPPSKTAFLPHSVDTNTFPSQLISPPKPQMQFKNTPPPNPIEAAVLALTVKLDSIAGEIASLKTQHSSSNTPPPPRPPPSEISPFSVGVDNPFQLTSPPRTSVPVLVSKIELHFKPEFRDGLPISNDEQEPEPSNSVLTDPDEFSLPTDQIDIPSPETFVIHDTPPNTQVPIATSEPEVVTSQEGWHNISTTAQAKEFAKPSPSPPPPKLPHGLAVISPRELPDKFAVPPQAPPPKPPDPSVSPMLPPSRHYHRLLFPSAKSKDASLSLEQPWSSHDSYAPQSRDNVSFPGTFPAGSANFPIKNSPPSDLPHVPEMKSPPFIQNSGQLICLEATNFCDVAPLDSRTSPKIQPHLISSAVSHVFRFNFHAPTHVHPECALKVPPAPKALHQPSDPQFFPTFRSPPSNKNTICVLSPNSLVNSHALSKAPTAAPVCSHKKIPTVHAFNFPCRFMQGRSTQCANFLFQCASR